MDYTTQLFWDFINISWTIIGKKKQMINFKGSIPIYKTPLKFNHSSKDPYPFMDPIETGHWMFWTLLDMIFFVEYKVGPYQL